METKSLRLAPSARCAAACALAAVLALALALALAAIPRASAYANNNISLPDDSEMTAVEATDVEYTATAVSLRGGTSCVACFTFSPSEDGYYTVEVTDGDYSYGAILDPDTYVGLADADSGFEAYLDASETYYLYFELSAAGDAVTVCVSASDGSSAYDDDDDESYDTIDVDSAIDLGDYLNEYQLRLGGDDSDYDEQWFSYTASSTGVRTFVLECSTSGEYFEVYVALYDADGRELDYSDAYGDEYDSTDTARVSASLVAGQTYYLYVRGWVDMDTGADVDVSTIEGGLVRLYGENRYETMAAIVSATFDSSEVAVVASGKSYADALAASYLAGVLDCPIITTSPTALSAEAVDQIEALGVEEVIIVGGESAVSADVADELADILGDSKAVDRVYGANRYETASAIVEEAADVYGGGDTAILAWGGNYADALCASPIAYAAGYPILLTKTDELPATTLAALEDGGYGTVVIVGGTSAVSQAVEDEVAALGIDVVRLAGSNRYATAVEIADYAIDEGILSGESLCVATGTNYPDALVGGVLAARADGVILLAASGDLSSKNNGNIDDYLSTCEQKIDSIYLFGGYSVVDEDLEYDLYWWLW